MHYNAVNNTRITNMNTFLILVTIAVRNMDCRLKAAVALRFPSLSVACVACFRRRGKCRQAKGEATVGYNALTAASFLPAQFTFWLCTRQTLS